MGRPLASICIPNYNYETYVDACIGSALAQTYAPAEVVFVDNCSTDGSMEAAGRYRDRIRIHRNEKNLGMVNNFNRSAQHARGEFLVFLSTDDLLKPRFLERTVAIMERHPEVGIVMVEREEIDAQGGLLQEIPFFYNQSCIVPTAGQLPVMMMTGIGVPCQVLVRRSVFEASGGFSPRFSHAFDWQSNFKCVLLSQFAYLRERLAQYRVFPGNSTAAMTRSLGMPLEHYLLLLDLKEIAQENGQLETARRFPEAVSRLAHMCLRYGAQMMGIERADLAERYLCLARAYDPGVEKDPFFGAISRGLALGVNPAALNLELETLGFAFRRTTSYDPPPGFRPLEWA